jgi:hypothetical protein
MPSSHSPDTLVVAFDDSHAVANAGLMLPATLAERLGIEAAIDELVDLGDRPGHHCPGRKVLTLVHAIVAGPNCIHDVDPLRRGANAQVLGHRGHGPVHPRPVAALRNLRPHPPARPRGRDGEILHARLRTGRAASGRGLRWSVTAPLHTCPGWQ